MTTKSKTVPIIIERTFDAPVSTVWRAITNRDDIKQWYFDLKEFRAEHGFEFRFVAEHEGVVYDHRCRVTEVIPNQKLAYTWRYEGHPGDSLVTFELFPEGSRTRLKLTHSGLETFPALPAFAPKNFVEGWTDIIGKSLREFFEKGGNTIEPFVISREFDAPRELVWKTWTERDHLLKWFGPKGFTMMTAKLDFRPGGLFHYSMRSPTGAEMWGRFLYREIVTPEKLVWVNSFSDQNGGITRHPFTSDLWPLELLTEVTFTEKNGRTTVRVQMTPLNASDEEIKTFESGRGSMKQGWTGTLDQLTDHLATVN